MPAALSARHANQLELLSELSRDLVHLLLDRERVVLDPFAAALRSYRVLGDPKEIGGSWRQLQVGDGQLRTLQRLDRDLLEGLAPARPRTALEPLAVASAATVAFRAWPITEVIAGPFGSVEAVDTFTDAIAAIHGVRYVTITPFGNGMIAAHVSYEDPISLWTRLGPIAYQAATVIAGTPAVRVWVDGLAQQAA